MSLQRYIQERQQAHPLLLMSHAVVGYPSLQANWEMLECLRDAGVDLVELQLPFSEPIADGPLFIKANQAALQAGIGWPEYFQFMREASNAFEFPLLFMGYYNSVFRMGHEGFCQRLHDAGGSGFIIADLPAEAGGDLHKHAAAEELARILMMTPVSSDDRLRRVAEQSSGFIYCVARTGVTGRATTLSNALAEYVKRCRAVTSLPLALGFGIRSAAHVGQLRGLVDIAIVGSAGLDNWERHGKSGYQDFFHALRAAATP